MKTSQFLKLCTVFPGILAVLLMMVFLTPAARANTTDFNLVGANSGSLDNIDTSPYSAQIGGGSTVSVICDDFSDHVGIPEDWLANVTPLATAVFPVANLQFSGSSLLSPLTSNPLTQAQAYTAAAYLAIAILNSTGTTQKDLSFAMWYLFSPTAVSNYLNGYPDTSTLATAVGDVNAALVATENQNPANYSNVTIYTYAAGGYCNGGSCPEQPQEFIGVTPEPASMLLFGTGLLGIAFIMRKRSQKDALL